jgi:hypothetical protein
MRTWKKDLLKLRSERNPPAVSRLASPPTVAQVQQKPERMSHIDKEVVFWTAPYVGGKVV